ncbi:hypothetical protein ACIRPH_10155 [Nocardiopsis sp. NPDC101807]|uniref:hypothetical protein n=1 Tax=Nocardiopsis sp. NPDC101807 TaxID=3364339 RepID=UPI0038308313
MNAPYIEMLRVYSSTSPVSSSSAWHVNGASVSGSPRTRSASMSQSTYSVSACTRRVSSTVSRISGPSTS